MILQQGKLELIMRQLTRQVGTIEPTLESLINNLSVADLDQLSEALFDFSDGSDLSSWLEGLKG
ncbi:DUF4351 domain-containing protein [Moorena bouillonii]|uniref:DUF4351 domain-containing protein n=1 Tax=Moorena bouillonii TaxID=207920 RepID=UPI0022A9E398|nr:DUF4351 domain-containing protein [Moorena bouillonii]